jgi:hypothetical protein
MLRQLLLEATAKKEEEEDKEKLGPEVPEPELPTIEPLPVGPPVTTMQPDPMLPPSMQQAPEGMAEMTGMGRQPTPPPTVANQIAEAQASQEVQQPVDPPAPQEVLTRLVEAAKGRVSAVGELVPESVKQLASGLAEPPATGAKAVEPEPEPVEPTLESELAALDMKNTNLIAHHRAKGTWLGLEPMLRMELEKEAGGEQTAAIAVLQKWAGKDITAAQDVASRETRAELDRMDAEYEKREGKLLSDRQEHLQHLEEIKALPTDSSFWEDKSTFGKIASAAAVFISGMMSYGKGGGNVALELIQKEIDRDIASKKDQIRKATSTAELEGNYLYRRYQELGDWRRAEIDTVNRGLIEASKTIDTKRAQWAGRISTAKGLKESNELSSKATKEIAEQYRKNHETLLKERRDKEEALYKKAQKHRMYAQTKIERGKLKLDKERLGQKTFMDMLNYNLSQASPEKRLARMKLDERRAGKAIKDYRRGSPGEIVGYTDLDPQDPRWRSFLDKQPMRHKAVEAIDDLMFLYQEHGKILGWEKFRSENGAVINSIFNRLLQSTAYTEGGKQLSDMEIKRYLERLGEPDTWTDRAKSMAIWKNVRNTLIDQIEQDYSQVGVTPKDYDSRGALWYALPEMLESEEALREAFTPEDVIRSFKEYDTLKKSIKAAKIEKAKKGKKPGLGQVRAALAGKKEADEERVLDTELNILKSAVSEGLINAKRWGLSKSEIKAYEQIAQRHMPKFWQNLKKSRLKAYKAGKELSDVVDLMEEHGGMW